MFYLLLVALFAITQAVLYNSAWFAFIAGAFIGFIVAKIAYKDTYMVS